MILIIKETDSLDVRIENYEATIKDLQEQADIDKMQIALYDKENKELRKQLRELQEVMEKIHILSLNPEVTRKIPNKTIFEKSNDIVWCECNNFWRDYLENGNS